MLSSIRDELISRIGGSVVADQNPGRALRNWRERLFIKQVDLAEAMGISPSVLSDYESGRRPSPGVKFVKRYIEALIRLDGAGGNLLHRLVEPSESSAILSISEFNRPVTAGRIVELVEGEVLSGVQRLSSFVYGYTLLDSIRTIYSLSGFDFYKIFGATTERALIFTKVGLGRSPLVAIRVSQFKPKMVILHGPKVVDSLAVSLAEKEGMVLALSKLPSEKAFIKVLGGL